MIGSIECADYTLVRIDEELSTKARNADGGWIIAGENYGQGPSRDNAALELAVLGVDSVIVESFTRINFTNLINFGVIPLTFAEGDAYDRINQGDALEIVGDIASRIRAGTITWLSQ